MLRVEVIVARFHVADVVQRRAVEVGAAADEERDRFRERLEDVLAGFFAGRDLRVGGERRDGGEERLLVGRLLRGSELGGEGRVLLLPRSERLRPRVVGRVEALLVLFEERACVVADVIVLRGQAEVLPRGLGELRAAFAVRLLRAGDLGDALADDRVRDDDLRLAACRRRRGVVGGEERVHVVAVDGLHIEADRLHALRGVFALPVSFAIASSVT